MKKSVLTYLAIIVLSETASAQTTSPSPYCNAGFDDDPFLVNDAIFGVTLGTLNNQSNAQCAAPHYIYYNNLAAPNLIKGSLYTLSATFDVHGGVGIGAWIDYNHNNVFEASEKILNNPPGGVPITLTAQTVNFTIPTSATTGTTRMRIRIVEDDNYNMANNYVIVPCNASTSATDVMDWGETEDYNINITVATGIKEQSMLVDVSVFPNPTENELVVSIPDPSQIESLQLKTINGENITVDFKIDTEGFRGNVSSLESGIYFLEIIDKSGNNKIYKVLKN